MHRAFKEYFEQNNMTIFADGAHGEYNGYEVNFFLSNPVKVHIAFYCTDEQKKAIINVIKENRDKSAMYFIDKYGITISVNNVWGMEKTAEKIIRLMGDVCSILANNGALGVGYCPICGKTTAEKSRACNVGGKLITLDSECASQVNDTVTNAPNNYLKGFVGALIGAAAGAVVAIILNIIGFYAGISSFVSVFVGILLYQKFGGKPNKMMLVIVTVTTFVMMIIAVLSIYLVIAASAAVEAGVSISAFEAFSICMEDKESGFPSAFYTDLIMTLLFTIVGCVAEIVKTARSIKRR